MATKYHYQRQLLLQGVVRFQHQATEVQIADILTKDLGGKAHRRHRDVIFGKKAIEIIANKLPDSCRMNLTRHKRVFLTSRGLRSSQRPGVQPRPIRSLQTAPRRVCPLEQIIIQEFQHPGAWQPGKRTHHAATMPAFVPVSYTHLTLPTIYSV